jgi:lipoprotein-anchoring transpeptidase ErfK/SrfK
VRTETFALARPRYRFGPCGLLAALAAAAMLIAAGGAAQAQDFGGFFSYEKAKPKKRTTAKRAPAVRAERSEANSDAASRKGEKSAAAKPAGAKGAKGPFFGVVSLKDQRISIYNSEGLVARSVISTGTASHPTPKGVFTIIGRNRYHRSNIYSGAPMPYMQRLTWSGVAMHQGVVPGYPASHGCIRLPGRFASQLWGTTSIGERVVVSPRDVVPQEFAHALLPVPKMQPAPEPVIETGGVAPAERLTQVATAEPGPEMIGAPVPDGPETKLVNPIAYAKLLKTKADADAKAAAKTVKRTLEAASAKTAEARRAVADVKSAQAAKAAAEAKAAEAGRALEGAQADAQAAAEVAKINADAELSSAASKLEAARAFEAVATPASFEAVQVWKQAKAAVAAAEAAAREAKRRVSPVSVLVSKKDQKVYIRQGLAPLLEAPATVRDPDVPLGTHLYIASAEQSDGASLEWSVISMPVPTENRDKTSDRKKRKAARGEEPVKDPEPVQRKASNAAEALERIEIPKHVSETIAELLWTGASLIISDRPLSGETSDIGTDLVVTLRY